MLDRAVRSLEQLQESASTARVLNLWRIAKRHAHAADYSALPLFQNPTLNSAIIVKHRIRGNEAECFPIPRRTATKILIPIDDNELKRGGRYVFIGQRRFSDTLYEAIGLRLNPDDPDARTLRILDETPSLDPFLLREQLRRHGLQPAACYFDISPADTQRMFAFAQREIEPLVRMSVGDNVDGMHAAKLTEKILANTADLALEPLRLTLQLEKPQYQEGIFCWKAFLYYKWQLTELLPRTGAVLQEILNRPAIGPMTDDTRAYLAEARGAIRRQVTSSCRRVKETLGVYDTAYRSLTTAGRPTEFRDFLLCAPRLFSDLGERLGAIEHIASFWRYRFPKASDAGAPADELVDLFMDFEASFNRDDEGATGVSRIASTVIEAC